GVQTCALPISEYSECQFSEFGIPFETKCHPRVQKIMQAKPIAYYIDLLMEVHIVMHQQLGCLINNDHKKGKQEVPACFHFFTLIFTFSRKSSSSTGRPSGTCGSRLRTNACVSFRM